MAKKPRQDGPRVNGFTETLAHLLELKEDFEAHHASFRQSIDTALAIRDPARRRQHISRVRYTLFGFQVDVIHTAKMALKYYPKRLGEEKEEYEEKIYGFLDRMGTLQAFLNEFTGIRDKAAHPPYIYSGWEILEKRNRIANHLDKLIQKLTETLEEGYGLTEAGIDQLVWKRRKRAFEKDLALARQAQVRILENSFKRSQRKWQTSKYGKIVPKSDSPFGRN